MDIGDVSVPEVPRTANNRRLNPHKPKDPARASAMTQLSAPSDHNCLLPCLEST